jgi:hypothetical protein
VPRRQFRPTLSLYPIGPILPRLNTLPKHSHTFIQGINLGGSSLLLNARITKQSKPIMDNHVSESHLID